jgi:hypothetical protein
MRRMATRNRTARKKLRRLIPMVSCGLLEFRARIGSGFNDNRWIFDLATGTLVGNLWDGDSCDATCGCTTRAAASGGP